MKKYLLGLLLLVSAVATAGQFIIDPITGDIIPVLGTVTVPPGSGITTLNTQTQATQSFATGTAGTDFGISSSSGVHTFNLPSASGTNRGLLSASDWSTFNGKQAAGSYITALTGDVTASGPGSASATVASVGGSSAANVNAATVLANAATNANTASAIVKRDASGNFSAGVITASKFVGVSPFTRSYISYLEDFLNWNQTSMHLQYSNSGGSVASTDSTANVPNSAHPGIWKYTSTLATNWSSLVPSTSATGLFAFGGGETVFETMVYFSALSDVTDSYTFYAGFNDTTSNFLNNNAIVLSYTHSANSGQWQCIGKTPGGGTQTNNSASAVAAGTWYRLTIVVNAAGTSADCQVNGSSVATVTNIPANAYNSAVEPWTAWVRSLGVTSRYVIWDYVAWSQEVNR